MNAIRPDRMEAQRQIDARPGAYFDHLPPVKPTPEDMMRAWLRGAVNLPLSDKPTDYQLGMKRGVEMALEAFQREFGA